MTRAIIRLFCALLPLGAGCDDWGPRVYTAQRYRSDLACLEAYIPIGLVEGTSLSALCEPVCLAQGEDVYVSTVCAPYPAEATLELPDSERCGAALAALAGEVACDAPGDAGFE